MSKRQVNCLNSFISLERFEKETLIKCHSTYKITFPVFLCMLSRRIRCAVNNAFCVHVVIIVSSDLHFNVDGLHSKITENNFRFECREQNRKRTAQGTFGFRGNCLQWRRECCAVDLFIFLGKHDFVFTVKKKQGSLPATRLSRIYGCKIKRGFFGKKKNLDISCIEFGNLLLNFSH